MSAITATSECYDFLRHCDNECNRVIIPYLNGIQRILFEHEHKSYYSIPFVIKSICCAYYCKHLHYRLSFKSFFAHHPVGYRSAHCEHDWKSCPCIQRMLYILANYQSYLQSQGNSSDALSPYITYKSYQMKQILHDISHINRKHPQNMIKFYIRNKVMQQVKHSDNVCACCSFEYNNDTEPRLKYNMLCIHQQFIHHSESKFQFERAVRHIVTNNQPQTIFPLLTTLRSVAGKLYRNDVKYRTLDASNRMVQERLMGFEGVLQYLSLLGFESNSIGSKLICDHAPSTHVIDTAISVINAQLSHGTNGVHFVEITKSIRKKSKQIRVLMNVALRLKTSGTEHIDADDEIAILMKLKKKTIAM